MQTLQVMNFHTEITFGGKEKKKKRKRKDKMISLLKFPFGQMYCVVRDVVITANLANFNFYLLIVSVLVV